MECLTKLFIPSVFIHTETSRSFTDAFFWLQCYYSLSKYVCLMTPSCFTGSNSENYKNAPRCVNNADYAVSDGFRAGVSNSFPGGLQPCSPAEFSSFPALTFKPCVFQISLKDLTNWIRCVQLGLKLNYAGLWPARN